ncbi:MAG TPA: TetR/AcrR family transcriptional regulator [Candidatus Dormibacteraeota bacterium]
MARRTRERILSGARGLLVEGEVPTVGQVAAAAGISRASFYRAFESRRALLEALEVEPEPRARERILDAGMDMVGASGLAAVSMDELAVRAGVSRATLYRLFPGKSALFTGLLRTFSPLEPVSILVNSMRDQPPDVVMPEIARTVFRTVYGSGTPRIGLLRAVVLELSSLSPDSEDAARDLVAAIIGSVGAYVMAQMAAGRLRPMHPLLALQSLVGPIFFHLLTRPFAERVLGLEIEGEQAVVDLAGNWLRAMKPDEEGAADG